jgi:hypothetical protein
MAAGAYAAGKAGAAVEEATQGLPHPAPEILAGGAAALAGFAGTAGTELALQEAKRRLGLDSESDSFSESLAHSLAAGSDTAMAEVWGRGVIDPMLQRTIVPYRPKYTPEEQANLTEMQGRLRGMYEKLTGRPTGEINWSPSKTNRSVEQSIEETDAARRLQATLGINPDEARKVAMGGPLNMAEATDNGLYGWLQKVVNNSSMGRKYLERYRGTRAKMLQMAANDLGSHFGEVVDPERLGEVISNAVDGKFSVLNGTRRQGVNAVQSMLPEGFTLDGKRIKMGLSTLDQGPGSLVAHLTDSPTFAEVQQVREHLGSMAHDLSLSPEVQENARLAAERLDHRTASQLPAGADTHYRTWTKADDAMNESQLNTEFVRGLMGQSGSYDKYAERIIKSKNLRNFQAFEAAVGPDVANNVRAAIWKKVAAGATQGETLRPEFMMDQLYKDGKYGKTFLDGVMGTETTGAYERLARGMQTLNTRMQETGEGRIGTGPMATTAGLGAGIGSYLANKGFTGNQAKLVAALLGTPALLGRIMTNPHAADLAAKLAEGVANKVGPMRLSRITGYIMEASGITPEEALMSSGVYGTQTIQQKREQWRGGKLSEDYSDIVPGDIGLDWNKLPQKKSGQARP